jgi:hypothetical protein
MRGCIKKASSKDGAFLWLLAELKQPKVLFHQPPTMPLL